MLAATCARSCLSRSFRVRDPPSPPPSSFTSLRDIVVFSVPVLCRNGVQEQDKILHGPSLVRGGGRPYFVF